MLFSTVTHCIFHPPTPTAADGAAGSNAADSADTSLVNGTSPMASSRSRLDGRLSPPPPTLGLPLPVLDRTDLGCAWAALGQLSSHMGQALKREATTGESAWPGPLAAAKMALAPVGPLTPQWSPEEGHTLGFRFGSQEAASHPTWPSPKHTPGPSLGKKAWGQDLG